MEQLSQQNQDLRHQMQRDKEFMSILEDNLTESKKPPAIKVIDSHPSPDDKYLSMVIKYENIIKEYQTKLQTLLDEKQVFTSKMETIFT